ncbi:MAG: amidohydrolase [Planctomycetota bacterium]
MRSPLKKKRIETAVQAESARALDMALQIHAWAEPPLKEKKSARLIADYLAEAGFSVTFPFPKIPTAFRAARGKGKPAIGFLGEYDALPNCGEKEGTWGHGCGHNLLGVASAVAAVAAARVLEAAGRSGRAVYYGCPAEEQLHGKIYMARDGAFRELDACLAWHPWKRIQAVPYGGSALDSLLFTFSGRTAHAAGNPHEGRSALDGVLLMDVAVNYLREHIPENVRIHSVIPRGGDAPNVVPAAAAIWYYLRGRNRAEVDAIRARVRACARGAALATGTRVRMDLLDAIYHRLPNLALHELLLENLSLFGGPRADSGDRRRARALGLPPEFDCRVHGEFPPQYRASSDDENVSWLAPLGSFYMVTHVKSTSIHHRNVTAQMRLPFAMKGMLQAAKVMAGAAADLACDPKRMKRVREEFRKGTRGFTYDPLISRRRSVPRLFG